MSAQSFVVMQWNSTMPFFNQRLPLIVAKQKQKFSNSMNEKVTAVKSSVTTKQVLAGMAAVTAFGVSAYQLHKNGPSMEQIKTTIGQAADTARNSIPSVEQIKTTMGQAADTARNSIPSVEQIKAGFVQAKDTIPSMDQVKSSAKQAKTAVINNAFLLYQKVPTAETLKSKAFDMTRSAANRLGLKL